MGYLHRLRDQLDAGHPVTGAYNAVDATAASEINALNIDVDSSIDQMVSYCCTTKNRTNDGGDTQGALLIGRLKLVADSEPYTDPFRRSGVWEAGGVVANEQIELVANSNKLIFGSAHDVSTINAKDSITLSGSTNDDGTQHVVAISAQEITLDSITTNETLERVFRVYRNQDAKLLTRAQIQNAKGILELLRSPSLSLVNFADTNINDAFTDMQECGVWKPADTAALLSFSQSLTSVALQYRLGTVEAIDVTQARAL